MSNWIRTGNWSNYRKAGLLSPSVNGDGNFKCVLLFFEQVEYPFEQHAIGYFNFFTKEWHLWSSPNARVYPSHFQLLTAPTQ